MSATPLEPPAATAAALAGRGAPEGACRSTHPAAATPAAPRVGTDTLPGLYGLRGVAALSVAVFHLVPNLALPPAFGFIGNYFGLGVQLFFVLSAFSLMYSTARAVDSPGWIRSYVLKRLFRIAPPFYAMILVFSVYNLVVWHAAPDPRVLVLNLTFLFNLVPGMHESIVWAGWTIGVEMLFYAVFPVALLMIRSMRSAAVFFLVSVLVAHAVRVTLLASGKAPAGYEHTGFAANLVYFSAGLLAFHVYEAGRRGLAQHVAFKLGIGATCVGLVALAAWPGSALRLLQWNLMAALWAALFGALCVWQALYPSFPFRRGLLAFCGMRSYSIYLVHALTVFSLAPAYRWIYAKGSGYPATLPFLLSVTLGVAAAIAVAEVMYRLVEQPSIRLGRTYLRKSRAPFTRTPLRAGSAL